MLAIRLARTGKKNRAQFQVVVQEHTVAPGGRHVEIVGSYDPHRKAAVLKEERVKYWLEKGAQPSDTMHNLFIAKNIITGEKRKVKMPAKKVEPAAAEAMAGEGGVTEEKKSEAAPAEAVKEEAKEEKSQEAKEETKEEAKTEEEKPAEEVKAE